MIETLKHFPKALEQEIKRQIPLIELMQRGAKEGIVPENLDLTEMSHPFREGFLSALGMKRNLRAKSDAAGITPEDKKKAFAAGEVLGSALRSIGTLASFWVLGNAVNAGAGALFGGIGHAVQAGAHQGLLAGLKEAGKAVLSAVTHHTNWGNALATTAGGAAFLDMADGAYQLQSGAVNGSPSTISAGKAAVLQGLAIALAVGTGFAFIPAVAGIGLMVANAVKSAAAMAGRAKAEKAAGADDGSNKKAA